MAAPSVFECFILDLGLAKHDFSTAVCKVALTNVAPNMATNTVLADITQIAASGGYPSGGVSIGALTWSKTGGVTSLAAALDAIFTATTGFGPFQWAILYNDSSASKSLICAYDNGAAVSTPASQTHTVDLSATIFSGTAS